MKVNLDLNGTELVLLYLATGNQSAGDVIRAAISEEKKFYERSDNGREALHKRRSLSND